MVRAAVPRMCRRVKGSCRVRTSPCASRPRRGLVSFARSTEVRPNARVWTPAPSRKRTPERFVFIVARAAVARMMRRGVGGARRTDTLPRAPRVRRGLVSSGPRGGVLMMREVSSFSAPSRGRAPQRFVFIVARAAVSRMMCRGVEGGRRAGTLTCAPRARRGLLASITVMGRRGVRGFAAPSRWRAPQRLVFSKVRAAVARSCRGVGGARRARALPSSAVVEGEIREGGAHNVPAETVLAEVHAAVPGLPPDASASASAVGARGGEARLVARGRRRVAGWRRRRGPRRLAFGRWGRRRGALCAGAQVRSLDGPRLRERRLSGEREAIDNAENSRGGSRRGGRRTRARPPLGPEHHKAAAAARSKWDSRI